jgi:hypothetical protein
MRLRLTLVAAAIAGLTLSGAAQARDERPPCAQLDVSLPPDLAAWSQRADLVAAAGLADLPKASLTPGRAVNAALHPTAAVAYVAAPGKPAAGGQGGLFGLRIDRAGTYRVVLGAGGWIDMLKNGVAVASSAHSPGPACSSARKMVDFPLERGDYVLQVSASPEPTVAILVIPRP